MARPRRHRTALTLLLALLAAALTYVPAAGQAADEQTRMVISRLTGVVGPGSVTEPGTEPEQILVRVLVEHTGPQDLLDAEVVIETYGRLTTRSLLRQALDDGIVGSKRLIERRAVRDAPVEPGDIAAVDVFLDVTDVTQSGASGVYPVQVSLTRGTDVLDRVVTAVVNLAERPTNPLATVAVWPVDTQPSQSPSVGSEALDRQIAPGGRLDGLTAGLEVGAPAGLVPAVSAHLLDALVNRAGPADAGSDGPGEPTDEPSEAAEGTPEQEAAAALLTRLRAVLETAVMEPLAGPYAEADLSSLVDAGPVLAVVGGDLAVDGVRRIASISGREPDSSALLVTSPLTPRALELLPSDHLLLPWVAVSDSLPDLDTEVPHPVREIRTLTGRALTATVADPWLAQALDDPDRMHGTAVAVQRILAETALAQLEAPGIADRPLLLLPPRDWDPGGRVARDLARGLASAPWLELVAPSAHARSADAPFSTPLAMRATRVQASVTQAVNEALTNLEAIRRSLPQGTTQLQGRNLADLELQLRRATSHWFALEPSTALAMVEDVEATIDAAYGVIEIPTGTGFTLVGERQEIPITIGRPSGDDLHVEVELRSSGQLAWPEGDTQPLLLTSGGRQTLSFLVEARARGDVGVEVIVRDAAGARVLADATIRVRSTLVSRPALLAVVAVILLLLLVGRLRRRPPSEGPDGGGPTDTGGEPGLTVVPTQSSSSGPSPSGGVER